MSSRGRTYARRRRVPASRQEMRDAATLSARPCADAPRLACPCQRAPAIACPRSCTLPSAPCTGCLYAPHECAVYRLPHQWCSSCDLRIRTLCAQMGWDVRAYPRQYYPPPMHVGLLYPPCVTAPCVPSHCGGIAPPTRCYPPPECCPITTVPPCTDLRRFEACEAFPR